MNRALRWIDPNDPLPDTCHALTTQEGANGLLAAGVDLGPKRLIEAYSRGIFPWFSSGEPVLWWSPSPRMVLMTDEFHLAKSLRKHAIKKLKDPEFEICADRSFSEVMQACSMPRATQSGTWISGPMIAAYCELHDLGLAHSMEVREAGRLVGGLYCVAIGKMIFGESMFTRQPNASKLALATLVAWGKRHGAQVIDCQQHTEHLESLGARQIDRTSFEAHVSELTSKSALPWRQNPPCTNDLRDMMKPWLT